MSFDNLTVTLQNIYVQEYENNIKWFLFLALIILSLIYLLIIWKNQQKTVSFAVAGSRTILFACSVIFLLSTPYWLILLSPEVSFWTFFMLPLQLYGLGITIFLILCGIDILRYGVPVLFKFGGLDFKDDKVNDIYNSLKNHKHGMK
jgi:hypothetical protein